MKLKPFKVEDDSMTTMPIDGAMNDDGGIWYFGAGPICHPLVRRRREVETRNEQAAILQDHRLTFAFGGVVNVVPCRGWEVHGVLMKMKDEEAWKKLKSYDAGTYAPQIMDVYPYPTDAAANSDTEQIFNQFDTDPVRCHVFVMTDLEESADLSGPIEKKPQERYLKLIQQGMRQYGVDHDYIEDQIMSCPYIPMTKREDWRSFPAASNRLPKMNFPRYERMCRRNTDLYLIMGEYVIKIGPHDDGNPLASWVESCAHGKPDIGLTIHKMIIDPNMPMVDTTEELTELHYAWAENHLVEVFEQSGFSGERVYRMEGCSLSSTKSLRRKPEQKSENFKGGASRSWRRPFSRSLRQNSSNSTSSN